MIAAAARFLELEQISTFPLIVVQIPIHTATFPILMNKVVELMAVVLLEEYLKVRRVQGRDRLPQTRLLPQPRWILLSPPPQLIRKENRPVQIIR